MQECLKQNGAIKRRIACKNMEKQDERNKIYITPFIR
jgi:hypothetical protein